MFVRSVYDDRPSRGSPAILTFLGPEGVMLDLLVYVMYVIVGMWRDIWGKCVSKLMCGLIIFWVYCNYFGFCILRSPLMFRIVLFLLWCPTWC